MTGDVTALIEAANSGDDDDAVRALFALEAEEPDLARLVELRFFTGLGVADIAILQSQSERTVVRNWRRAKVQLHAAIHPDR